MLSEPQTPAYVDLIRAGKGVHDTDTWLALKSDAQRWKPDRYDEHQVNLRLQYEGRIEEHLAAVVQKRFKQTGQRMPMIPLNFARLYAENGAAVYDYPPQWFLQRDGKRVDPAPSEDAEDAQSTDSPEDQQRAADFAQMVEEASLDVVMAEAERRAVLARTVFLRVHSDSVEAAATGEPPRTRLTMFWPSDVLVIPHPLRPEGLSTCVALMARVSGAEGVAKGGATTWEVWTRAFEDDEFGTPKFGPWRVERVTETQSTAAGQARVDARVELIRWRTDSGGVSDVYPLKSLPWLAMHNGIPEGCPFIDADRNLVALFDAVNLGLMSEHFAVDMCAAPILYRKTDAPQPKEIALGPGILANVALAESIDSLSQATDFAGMRQALTNLVGLMAVTHRQDPSGFDVQRAGAPVSGVALAIRREPQTKARLEAVARAVDFARALLAVMVEVHDYWRATSIGDEGVSFVMSPTDPPEYEDREATQRRWLELRDHDLASDEEVRVNVGASRTLEEARAVIEKLKAEKSKAPSPFRLSLERLAQQRPMPAQPDDADTEDERQPPDMAGE